MVIFAGDFYQYPPVGGTPLYTPISAYAGQSNEEIAKRLGCMAWKSVNSVITLTEQERMKGDPEYAVAVQHLQICECTMEDAELFNTCVIKSATNQDGIDMSIAFRTGAGIPTVFPKWVVQVFDFVALCYTITYTHSYMGISWVNIAALASLFLVFLLFFYLHLFNFLF